MSVKSTYVKNIKENTEVDDLFLVKDKNSGMTRNGKPYWALNLSDKTGEVKGRIWDNAAKLGNNFSQGDIVRIKSYAILYQGSLQLNISAIAQQSGDYSMLSEFLPASSHDPDKTLDEFLSFTEYLQDKHLKDLIAAVFNDENIATAFKKAPAAKTIHHDYLGGLLEHTLNVVKLAIDVSKYYRNINRDILLVGAMLHDIGKIHELSYERNFDYTDAGRLVGHITLGVEIIAAKINQLPDFPEAQAMILKHLILSHHGQYDFGSPKRPKTLEALLLSYLDDIDAKMYELAQFIKRERQPDAKWTGYHRIFDRYIYTDTFIEDEIDSPDFSKE